MFRVLEKAEDGDRLSRAIDAFLASLILTSVIAVVLESIPSLERRYSDFFYWFEVATVSVFSVEYLLRVWSSVENDALRRHGGSGLSIRLRYIMTPYALIDLIAILPFYLVTFGVFGAVDMRFLRAVRLLRVLKLSRYSTAFGMLGICMKENSRALAATFFVLLTVMLIAASGMYFFERHAQPVKFGSIPASMWWAFSTLTTVGYGDVTPVTAGGRVFGALITVLGIGMVALPTGILASGYTQQLRLRSDRYQAKADEALDDGILSDMEITELEELRLDLGLGKHTASQILDVEKVKAALRSAGQRCPHCGAVVPVENH